jgi:hypothetical protein
MVERVFASVTAGNKKRVIDQSNRESIQGQRVHVNADLPGLGRLTDVNGRSG